jgi:hypothetical protein
MVITPAIIESIQTLYNDDSCQEALYSCNESAPLAYFADNIERISSPNFQLDPLDYIYTKSESSGIVETEIIYNKSTLLMYDFPAGTDFKSIDSMFNDPDLIVYVVGLDQYDNQEVHNRRKAHFKKVLKRFPDKSVLLLFNKIDLFRQKVRSIPYRDETRNSSYKGKLPDEAKTSEDFEKSIASIQKHLKTQYDRWFQRYSSGLTELFPHFVSSTDFDQVELITNATKSALIKNNLRNTGFF